MCIEGLFKTNRGKRGEGVYGLLVLPEKNTELPAGRALLARGELSRRDRALLPSLPPVRELPGVQGRFLSNKCLLAPRLARDARWPA